MHCRACDSCEEWYHGDCIGVTQLDARCIKKYFCDSCRGKHGSKIKMKGKKKGGGGTRKLEKKEKREVRGKVDNSHSLNVVFST